jgi:hypothetical protein
MTSAIAAMEHNSNGQIGQPAACMIENKRLLSADSDFWDARLWTRQGHRARFVRPLLVVQKTLRRTQSTADVDNFVGNLAPIRAKPRKRATCNGLLKT